MERREIRAGGYVGSDDISATQHRQAEVLMCGNLKGFSGRLMAERGMGVLRQPAGVLYRAVAVMGKAPLIITNVCLNTWGQRDASGKEMTSIGTSSVSPGSIGDHVDDRLQKEAFTPAGHSLAQGGCA
jgi:hypothetical protein